MTDRELVRDARAVVCFFLVPRAAMHVHVKKKGAVLEKLVTTPSHMQYVGTLGF